MSQDEGASTEVTGSLVSSMALITAGNGSRTSPEKLNPAEVHSQRTRQHQRKDDGSPPTEDGIKDMVSLSHGSWEVVGEWNIQVLQLF